MSDQNTVVTHDLFGNEVSIKFGDGTPKKNRDTPTGNASPIGSGPAGETCRTCAHAYCYEYAKRYWKCGLVKATHSPKTDIRLKWAACSQWEKRIEETKT